MITIKAVVFDYGNVICEPQRATDHEEMASACGLTVPTLQKFYWQLREAFDRGDYDAHYYWLEVGRLAGVALRPSQINQAILLDSQSWSRPSLPVVQWIDRLAEAGFRTAILSNMPLALRQHLDQHCDWLPQFDYRVFSCDVQCIKPDEQIYRHCLELLQLEPAETLFLDDRVPNIEAATKIGMNGLVFENFDQAAPELALRFRLPSLDPQNTTSSGNA